MKIQILGSINPDGEKVYSIWCKKFLFRWKLFNLVKLYVGGRISTKPFYYPNAAVANAAVQICYENRLLLSHVIIVFNEKSESIQFIPKSNIERNKLKNISFIYNSFQEAYQKELYLRQVWTENLYKVK
jgi:hypothetical protein